MELGRVLRKRQHHSILVSLPQSRELADEVGERVFESCVRDRSGNWCLIYRVDDKIIVAADFQRRRSGSQSCWDSATEQLFEYWCYRHRLGEGGWNSGGLCDFLSLGKGDLAMIDIRIELAYALQEIRFQRRWSQSVVARELGSSQSQISAMENAKSEVSLDLMIRSLLELGLTRAKIAALVRG